MTAIHETVYPRLRSNISEKELVEIYTPQEEDLNFVDNHTKTDSSKLGLLVLLKLFQRLGYFPRFEEIPPKIVQYIGLVIGLRSKIKNFETYKNSELHKKHLVLIRDHLKVKAFSDGGKQAMMEALINASLTKDIIADIINTGIEELIQASYELPGFSTLYKSAYQARGIVNKSIYNNIFNSINEDQKEIIRNLIKQDKTKELSLWNKLKQEPKRPTVTHMREFIKHLDWLKSLNIEIESIHNIPEAKLQRFSEEAKTLDLYDINEIYEQKRFTLGVFAHPLEKVK